MDAPADRRGSLLKATDSGGQLGDAVGAAYQSAPEHAVPAAQVATLEKHLRSIAVALNDANRMRCRGIEPESPPQHRTVTPRRGGHRRKERLQQPAARASTSL